MPTATTKSAGHVLIMTYGVGGGSGGGTAVSATPYQKSPPKKPRKPRAKQPPKPKATCERCGNTITADKLEKHHTTWTCISTGYMLDRQTVLPAGMKFSACSSPDLMKLAQAAGLELMIGTAVRGGAMFPTLYGPDWLIALEEAWYRCAGDSLLKADLLFLAETFATSAQVQRDGFMVEMALLEDTTDWYEKRESMRRAVRKAASEAMSHLPSV